MNIKPWVRYDLCEQIMQCEVCSRLEVLAGGGPVQRFLAEVSAFSRGHQHQELTPSERIEAVRQWREDPEAG